MAEIFKKLILFHVDESIGKQALSITVSGNRNSHNLLGNHLTSYVYILNECTICYRLNIFVPPKNRMLKSFQCDSIRR